MCIARKLYIGSLAISRAINKEFSLIVEPYLNWGPLCFGRLLTLGIAMADFWVYTNCH
ncbi:hypothetical protein BofuT4_uP132540.1 [Botrytis cinerea T4]|uniref:Uncharacterized protein n=1 Tax=Botryotinia fuckeliana (strain T4) TaxID=999810 RepID=G2YR26_BOTF4|nr:hypothetical protein BofuT4_uP132540.1 [Botrytis cinerea T4]